MTKNDALDNCPRILSLGSLIESVRDGVFSGKRPIEFPIASEPWGSIALRPGEVMGLAAPPGTGKTALAMQMVVDALRLKTDARCLVVNVEMSPAMLIERQVSRLSGVSYTDIAARTMISLHARRIEAAIATLASIGDRLFFMQEPFSIEMIGRSLLEVRPQILLVDYVQRIDCGDGQFEPRIRLNHVMSEARNIASAGIAVMLISAVGRTSSKRNGGYSSRELGLGSFRESSEIEYGLDDGFILSEESGGAESGKGPRIMQLQHVKSRSHQREDLRLEFDGAVQQFRLHPDHSEPKTKSGINGPAAGTSPAAPGVIPKRATCDGPLVDRWSQELLGEGLL